MVTRVGNFPDWMLRSWLRVIGWWWSGGQHSWLSPLMGSQLYDSAVNYSVQPPAPEREVTQLLDGNGTVLAVTSFYYDGDGVRVRKDDPDGIVLYVGTLEQTIGAPGTATVAPPRCAGAARRPTPCLATPPACWWVIFCTRAPSR